MARFMPWLRASFSIMTAALEMLKALGEAASMALVMDLYAPLVLLSKCPTVAVAAVASPVINAPCRSMPFCKPSALAAPWAAMLPTKPAAKPMPNEAAVEAPPASRVEPVPMMPPILAIPSMAPVSSPSTPAVRTVTTAITTPITIDFQKLV